MSTLTRTHQIAIIIVLTVAVFAGLALAAWQGRSLADDAAQLAPTPTVPWVVPTYEVNPPLDGLTVPDGCVIQLMRGPQEVGKIIQTSLVITQTSRVWQWAGIVGLRITGGYHINIPIADDDPQSGWTLLPATYTAVVNAPRSEVLICDPALLNAPVPTPYQPYTPAGEELRSLVTE